MKIRICIISDTHGYHDAVKIEPCDILVCAGDCTDDIGRASLRNFLVWWEKQPAKHKILIAGNHDGAFDKWPDLARLMIKEISPDTIYLQDNGCEIEGIKFWGSPYTPTFFNWYFMRDRGDAIKRHWDMIPDGIDFLVTHGPPFPILDVSGFDGANCGCSDLRNAVEKIKPKIHCFGHVHHSYGMKEKTWEDGKKTIFINASICDEAYRPKRSPFIYYYETE